MAENNVNRQTWPEKPDRLDWDDISPDRQAHIEVSVEIAEDFPDGAFYGFLMEERGISVDEIEAYFREKGRVVE